MDDEQRDALGLRVWLEISDEWWRRGGPMPYPEDESAEAAKARQERLIAT